MTDLDRRRFLRTTTAAASTVAAASLSAAPNLTRDDPQPAGPLFESNWHRLPDRVWIGPDFWANPLQDWRIADGRLECVNPARNRNVHLLTRDVTKEGRHFEIRVTLGRVGGKLDGGKGSAGFRLGIRGPLEEYRNNVVYGSGLDAGITADGRLFIGRPADGRPVDLNREAITLVARYETVNDVPELILTAEDAETGRRLTQVQKSGKQIIELAGNIALVSNFGPTRLPRGNQNSPYAALGTGKFWFRDLKTDGPRIAAHPDRLYGPILFSQYTLHDGTLKMTAQMPPVGEGDEQQVRLEVGRDDERSVANAVIAEDARTATIEIDDWDATKDVPYQLVWTQRYTDGVSEPMGFVGTIRKDPADADVLTVADISCNIHTAFPNHEYTAGVAKLDPDLVCFVGDQFYESTGGYGVQRKPIEPAILDYLHKWYIHGWTWRDVIRDRPSIAIPDDHDVYQGNIWGEAGAGPQGTQEMGGYGMPVRWVNVVHATQTSHHPAPHTGESLESGITVYHGPLTYGGVSFAILADRMFKTGPQGVVPPTKGRGDHVTDPNFDPKTADVEGAELLGDRQMAFLEEWVKDWEGARMKAVVSQTIFSSMATTHGGPGQRLVADYDANGWPQTARNAAVSLIRKCFAVHLAGDQHLPAVIHYGVEEHRDAGVAFAGPAVNVGYPRWWEPRDRAGKDLEPLGDHRDHMHHPMTVLAVKNGAHAPRRGNVLENVVDKASGLGVVRFDKRRRTITFECWPYDADPTTDAQFPGWPVKVDQTANGRNANTQLPRLEITGATAPVVEVTDERGDLVYTLRIEGTSFVPMVPAEGTYEVTVRDGGRSKTMKVGTDRSEPVRVEL